MENLNKIIWVPIAILVFAVIPLPYAYYMLLRLIIPFFAIIFAIHAYNHHRNSLFPYLMGAMALVYNPFFPVHLFKELWIVINLLSAAIFYFYKNTFDPRDQ